MRCENTFVRTTAILFALYVVVNSTAFIRTYKHDEEESLVLKEPQEESSLTKRHVRPKSIFIAPTFSSNCGNGYRPNGKGGCMKIIGISNQNSKQFLLDKLNSNFANRQRKHSSHEETSEPLQVKIPFHSEKILEHNYNLAAISTRKLTENFPFGSAQDAIRYDQQANQANPFLKKYIVQVQVSEGLPNEYDLSLEHLSSKIDDFNYLPNKSIYPYRQEQKQMRKKESLYRNENQIGDNPNDERIDSNDVWDFSKWSDTQNFNPQMLKEYFPDYYEPNHMLDQKVPLHYEIVVNP